MVTIFTFVGLKYSVKTFFFDFLENCAQAIILGEVSSFYLLVYIFLLNRHWYKLTLTIYKHTKNKMLLLNYANVIKQSKKLTIS